MSVLTKFCRCLCSKSFLFAYAYTNLNPTFFLQGAAPSDSLAISHLIRAYQVNGHEAANLDPLELFNDDTFPYRPKPQADGYPSNLELEYYGFSEEDLDRKLHLKGR